jgi:hypothetical protein
MARTPGARMCIPTECGAESMINPPTRGINLLQTYQVMLFNRALHPELFQLKARSVIQGDGYELESWVMPGRHLLRFTVGDHCLCELVTESDQGIPDSGVIAAFFCAGERDFDRDFKRLGMNYMTTVQTEQLNDNIYISTIDEMRGFKDEPDALIHEWDDDFGPCLSVLAIQRYNREIHAQAYHCIGNGRIVLRTQTIFETHS